MRPDASALLVYWLAVGCGVDPLRGLPGSPAAAAHGGNGAPLPEACNGLDDDGDGQVDEVCTCRPLDKQPCYPGNPGDVEVGICAWGAQVCTGEGGPGVWGACEGAVQPFSHDRCGNGIDDDCNGWVDDNCGPEGAVEDPSGPDGGEPDQDEPPGDAEGACTEGQTRACTSGVPSDRAGIGVCAAGVETCTGGTWTLCAGAVLPTEEICDGVDNDCDGDRDDGCTCVLGEDRPCYPGGEGQEGVGICQGGSQRCVAAGADNAWGACDGAVLPSAESCGDGIDSDCNGLDEPCPEVIIDLSLRECVWTSCPADHPYPIACNLIFQGGDDRGCVVNDPGSSDVYFKEGSSCGGGSVTGTLTCSIDPGTGLDVGTCPMNRQHSYHEASPSGCPD